VTRYDVQVQVMPRASLLDPQGQAVDHALTALGFEGHANVRVGRALTLQLELAGADAAGAEEAVRRMCERLLANPVTEDFTISLREAP
jgi:phosphoribosylformylglycinamidine synthase